MAVSSEELAWKVLRDRARAARVYAFPTEQVRARARAEEARRRRMLVRRRRAGLAAFALSVVLLGVFGGGPDGSAPASNPAPRAVVLRPGQTIWDLAERHAPSGVDVRAYVDAVIELNGLDGAAPAGARIRLPR